MQSVHAAGSASKTVGRRRSEIIKFFPKANPSPRGIEACAPQIGLREMLGHEVKLIPPSQVKSFIRRGVKNDAAAICEAVRRPHWHSVTIKSEANQPS